MDMKPQIISKEELTAISSFHLRRLGWSYMLDTILADREVGFPCEQEEFIVRRELRDAFSRVANWFKGMGVKHKWPSRQGWMWEIDFIKGVAIPKQQDSSAGQIGSAKNEQGLDCLLSEGPIMDLGEMDLDIIKRLLEKREANSDYGRSQLRKFMNKESSKEQLYEIIQELGQSVKDVLDWFSEMAVACKWPVIDNRYWMYRVDIEEEKVFLSRKGNSVCNCSQED